MNPNQLFKLHCTLCLWNYYFKTVTDGYCKASNFKKGTKASSLMSFSRWAETLYTQPAVPLASLLISTNTTASPLIKSSRAHSSPNNTLLYLWLTSSCISLFSKRELCKIPTHSSFSHHSKLTSFSKYFKHLSSYTNPSHSRFKSIPRESNQTQMVVMTTNYLS